MRVLIAALLLMLCGHATGQENDQRVLFHAGPDKLLPFSPAVEVGKLVFLSGALGAKPGEMTVVPGGIVPETRQTLDNIQATLAKLGLGMQHVVKCTVMLADIEEWGAFNEVYRKYFNPPFPARSAFAAKGLAIGARVEVECIAARP